MSLHEGIIAEMQRYIDEHADCAVILPAAVAAAAYSKFAPAQVEAHVQYGCIEHYKGMARKLLVKQYDPKSNDSVSYLAEGELFSGHLQDRYPLPRIGGVDAGYKRRSLLTSGERAWNVGVLRKSANARLYHADALEAEGLGQA